jgi:hypothetical protein
MNLNRIIPFAFSIIGLFLIMLRVENVINKYWGGLGFLLTTVSIILKTKRKQDK